MSDFEQFWAIICDKMVLPEVAKDIIQDAWDQIRSQPTPLIKQKRTRPLSGYNLYMKDQLLAMRDNCDLCGSERMKEVGRRWRELTPNQQNVWHDKASEEVPLSPTHAPPSSPTQPPQIASASSPPPQVAPTTSPSPPVLVRRAPTGYNLFLKDRMTEFKDRKVPAKQRMRHIGDLWRKLTPQEKKDWTERAERTQLEISKEEEFPPESS